jgi:hypothetical protein
MRTTTQLRSAMLTFDPGWTPDLDKVRAKVIVARKRRRIAVTGCTVAMVLALGGTAVALGPSRVARTAMARIAAIRTTHRGTGVDALPTRPKIRNTALPSVPSLGAKKPLNWRNFQGWLRSGSKGDRQVCVGDGTTSPYCTTLTRSGTGWLAAERYGAQYTVGAPVLAVVEEPLTRVVVAQGQATIPATIVDLGHGYRLVVAVLTAEAGTPADTRVRLWGFDPTDQLIAYADLS